MNDNTNFELNGFDSAYKSTGDTPAEPGRETEAKINNEEANNDGVISATFGAPIEPEESGAESTATSTDNATEKPNQPNDTTKAEAAEVSAQHNAPPAKETSYSPRANYNLNGNPYGHPVYGTPINNQSPTNIKRPKEPKRFSAATVVVSIICSALIAFASSIMGISYYLYNTNNSSAGGSSATEIKNIVVEEEGLSVVEAVYEKCGPSIVGIRTTTSVMSFFGGQEVNGEGSGIIYSADGYILTNYHVISDSSASSYYGSSGSGVASKIDVYLPSDPETPIPATVIGYNISSDLAVIKIDKTGLPAIEVGDSDDINVGQFVIAIGNPGGLQFMGSVTYGVVGGVNRSLEIDAVGTMNLIQTDAAINPGNSGGALVNTEGKLIGINSSKLVDESYEGMGFAIPINEALEICDKIIENKDEPAPYLGVEVSTRYTSEVLSYYNYPAGAVISSVDNGSPAHRAGIQRGDIITKFAGVDISEYTLLSDTLKQCTVGQTVEAVVYRSGRYLTFNITIGSSN